MKQIIVTLSVLLVFVITIIILKQLHKNTIPNTLIINVSAITSPCSLAINYQGDIIASGGFYGDLCLWDRSSGALIDRVVLRKKRYN